MGCLSDEQLKRLLKLKKELEEKENAQNHKYVHEKEPINKASVLALRNQKPNPPVKKIETKSSQADILFSRLANNNEGIQYRKDGQWIKATLGGIDRYLLNISTYIGSGKRKVAFGFPRVPVGISTWLAVSVMISHIIFSKEFKIQRNKSMKTNLYIMIASRERSIRDLYLSQRLLFSGQAFTVDKFPVFRFKRGGSTESISNNSQPNELSIPVVFYHFDNMDSNKLSQKNTKVGLILAEISESDSRLSSIMLERLESLTKSFNAPKTCLFFNSFDSQLRNHLIKNGYEITDIEPNVQIDKNEKTNIPSIVGAFSKYSIPQEVCLEVVDDGYEISRLLYECVCELAKVNEAIQSNECRNLLAKWWNIWRNLKDMAIPLDVYERYRMHAQGRGSLENIIQKISSSANHIYTPEGKIMQSVAPIIANRLKNIYSGLSRNCPKAKKLTSLIEKVSYPNQLKTLFVLNEKSQVSALKEQFLFTNTENFDNLLITYFSKAVSVARESFLHNCVFPGVWAPWQNSILVAMGTPKITILIYPYEVAILEARIEEHKRECELLSESNLDSGEQYRPIIAIPSTQMQLLDRIQDQLRKSYENIEKMKAPKWLDDETIYASDGLESDEEIQEGEPVSGGIKIILNDNSHICVRPHSEMMLVTDDGVETVFAYELSEGDEIAIMRGDASRSIFRSVLTQVNHLLKVDERVIDIWQSSIRKILFDGQKSTESRSISSIIPFLRERGCNKSDMAIRQWFKGLTLAPSESKDIGRVLDLAGVTKSSEISVVVAREMNEIRKFNRALGKNIKARIKASVTKGRPPNMTRLDFEIEEAIEAIEYKTIIKIESTNGAD